MKDRGRVEVAKEAARLLYYDFVEDYKSAKEAACNSLGVKALPSNFEVAMELNRLADEVEGASRRELLIGMREKALQIMGELEPFNPKLVGSVWRGTSKKGSDIDITAHSERAEAVVEVVKKRYDGVRTEYRFKTSEGVTKRYFHIYFNSPPSYEVEVVVRSPEEINERCRCEIYGDYIVGLTRCQLQELLERDAVKSFLPERKWVEEPTSNWRL